MAFKLGDLIVDRIVNGVAENSNGELLYNLSNLQEATIDITADSTDVVDGTGAVIIGEKLVPLLLLTLP